MNVSPLPRDVDVTGLRAGAPLPLTGRYGPMAEQSRLGLAAWAAHAGIDLLIEDCGEAEADAADAAVDLAPRVDLLFGPYGSGAMRAVAAALSGREIVCWNHGGSATSAGAWVVDVLSPAECYWSGLGSVLAARRTLEGVAVLSGASGFARAVSGSAVASLAAAGVRPCHMQEFDQTTASAAARAALAAGARVVIGSGRLEEDVALGRALAEHADLAVGLVLCGSSLAAARLGDRVCGWIGPALWLPGDDQESRALGAGADYPAAQAYAAGQIALRAVALAGGTEPRALWDAARRLRTATFYGPFAIDAAGRQIAHRPLIVEWVRRSDGLRREAVWRPEGDG